MSDTSGISLGAVNIPPEACLQGRGLARGRDESRALLTLSDGSVVIQTRWTRATYTLSGAGWTPPGLLALDRSATHTLVYPDPAAPGSSVSVACQIQSGPEETYNFNGPGGLSVTWSITVRATA